MTDRTRHRATRETEESQGRHCCVTLRALIVAFILPGARLWAPSRAPGPLSQRHCALTRLRQVIGHLYVRRAHTHTDTNTDTDTDTHAYAYMQESDSERYTLSKDLESPRGSLKGAFRDLHFYSPPFPNDFEKEFKENVRKLKMEHLCSRIKHSAFGEPDARHGISEKWQSRMLRIMMKQQRLKILQAITGDIPTTRLSVPINACHAWKCPHYCANSNIVPARMDTAIYLYADRTQVTRNKSTRLRRQK